MPMPFDAVFKELIGWRPADYLALAGLPVPEDPADVVLTESELSTVTAAADKIIRVKSSPVGPYLAVVEFQSGPDPRLDDRVAMYNAVARWRSNLPVRNVVYQLRRQASGRGMTGRVSGPGLMFMYELIPVWHLSAVDLLTGPIGTVPLAALTDLTPVELTNCVDVVLKQLRAKVPAEKLKDVLAQTAVLLGLRYDSDTTERLMQSVVDMEESSVYQAIKRKGHDEGFSLGRMEGEDAGRAEGLAEGRLSALVDVAASRLGPPPAGVHRRLATVGDGRLMARLLTAASWDELLAD